MAAEDEKPIAERILDAAVAVLRRHGADKTNVVDIARAMGMSHGNIYRHFPSKQALINAVAVRWLKAIVEPLEVITLSQALTPAERLEAWFHALRKLKKRKVLDDPELFQVYHQIVSQMAEVTAEHVTTLTRQVESIIAEGIEAGEFSTRLHPPEAARAFLQATAYFHHPALLVQSPPPSDEQAKAVIELVLAGLR